MEIEETDNYGNKFIFRDRGDKFSIQRNVANSSLKAKSFGNSFNRKYYITLQDRSIVLSDEDMLDLFRAYLAMKAEYDAE